LRIPEAAIIALVGKVRVSRTYPGSVYAAQTCWCDTARWPDWVDGLARVVAVQGDWPRPGSSVTWESGPSGRGRVHERVIEYETLSGLAVAVQDDSIEARQRVGFEPAPGGVAVQLSLEYSLKRRSPLTPLVDRLFVGRPMRDSLTKTLERFGTVLEESRPSSVG
jgi:uncharacterized membrane protein